MSEQQASGSGLEPPQPQTTGEEDEQPSISGAGCIGVIVASLIASALLYVLVLSRNPETRGPAYMAVSVLFGFFVIGIVWGVIQQQRESDAARDAEIDALDQGTSQDK